MSVRGSGRTSSLFRKEFCDSTACSTVLVRMRSSPRTARRGILLLAGCLIASPPYSMAYCTRARTAPHAAAAARHFLGLGTPSSAASQATPDWHCDRIVQQLKCCMGVTCAQPCAAGTCASYVARDLGYAPDSIHVARASVSRGWMVMKSWTSIVDGVATCPRSACHTCT